MRYSHGLMGISIHQILFSAVLEVDNIHLSSAGNLAAKRDNSGVTLEGPKDLPPQLESNVSFVLSFSFV